MWECYQSQFYGYNNSIQNTRTFASRTNILNSSSFRPVLFLGQFSLNIRSILYNCFNKTLPQCNIKVIFQSKNHLSNLFRFKGSIPKELQSHLVYKFSCSNCNITCYSETERHVYVRSGGHSSLSALIGKRVNNSKKLLFFVFVVFFVSIVVSFHRHWRLTGQQGKGGDHLLFHSTSSTCSQTFRHLFATLHVRWLSHIFNSTACARWYLPPYRITIWLIDDVMLSLVCLLVELIVGFVTAIWHGKPVDLNLHRLSSLYYKRNDYPSVLVTPKSWQSKITACFLITWVCLKIFYFWQMSQTHVNSWLENPYWFQGTRHF